MTTTRRKFLQLSSLASASFFVPKFLKALDRNPLQQGDKILIVLQLTGGNDGLNTVIPVRNDIYYKSRPVLGIARNAALRLTDDVGLHPGLKGLKEFFDNGELSIINSVGYPDPNRSHFRSMDIWQSGSGSNETLNTGWVGRYLDHNCATCDTRNSLAIEVDDSLSLAMKGNERNAIAVRDISQFYKAANNSFSRALAHQDAHDDKLASYLYKTLRETNSASDYIYECSRKYNSTQQYPNSQIGKRIKTIASLILSGADTRVYYLSFGSFDTHVGQQPRQEKLFGELNDALVSLVADLKAHNRFNDVAIMSFSEFGRKLTQNANNGTDHGTSGNMFVISGGLKRPGLYNDMPDLTKLEGDAPEHQVDFRQVYSTMLEKWLGADASSVFNGKFDHLNFI